MSDESVRARGRCPICKAPTAQDWRPFCSRRCADVDLGRWMTGRYSVPGEDGSIDPPRDE